MLMHPIEYDATCIHMAFEGIGESDENVVIEILCARPNHYLEALKECYEEKFGNSLENALYENTRSWAFDRLMIKLLQCEREQGKVAVDMDEAEADAQELFDAGEDRWDRTDESVFFRIIAEKSWLQIRLICKKYEEISEMTLEDAIRNEIDDVLRQTTYIAIVRIATDLPFYFSRNLFNAITGGEDLDSDAVNRSVIFTSEWALQTIKENYEETNGSTLIDDINDNFAGENSEEYKAILRDIVKE